MKTQYEVTDPIFEFYQEFGWFANVLLFWHELLAELEAERV